MKKDYVFNRKKLQEQLDKINAQGAFYKGNKPKIFFIYGSDAGLKKGPPALAIFKWDKDKRVVAEYLSRPKTQAEFDIEVKRLSEFYDIDKNKFGEKE